MFGDQFDRAQGVAMGGLEIGDGVTFNRVRQRDAAGPVW
jgi:hypothetical protein